ncbi:hypothetical protein PACTADRAFT_31879 [Pachysolen tannophilus NRRL Y-2460]|uniref:Protein sym1 n=1 Tax=Pachysolen tannophilus NRRL Y-2460 TaxID=669874 RepID=A0A1E4U3K4_PACTA|nr:hypothetical protein PACTADRAFT_31879 [Pachysolen tannophilus NRRL Y-2460]
MPIQLPLNEEDADLPNVSSGFHNPFATFTDATHNVALSNPHTFSNRLKRKIGTLLRSPLRNIPIINYVILIVLSSLLIKLTFHYHRLYTFNSVVATCMTNIVLFGIADTLAQSIASYQKARKLSGTVGVGLSDIESHPSYPNQRKNPSTIADYSVNEFPAHSPSSSPYDLKGKFNKLGLDARSDFSRFNFRRFIGFTAWGFLMAFIQVLWYFFLNSSFLNLPFFFTILGRVLADQLIFSPINLYSFFAYSTLILEKGSKEDFNKKIQNVYFSTLVANFSLWFPVQFINFLIMPVKFQVPFSSTVGVLWNCFLSMKNAGSSTATEIK